MQSSRAWWPPTAASHRLVVVQAGKKGIGITLSVIGIEEGNFRLPPWFWGAIGDLTQGLTEEQRCETLAGR